MTQDDVAPDDVRMTSDHVTTRQNDVAARERA